MVVFRGHKTPIKAVDSDVMLIWRLTVSTNDNSIRRTEPILFNCEL